MFFSSHEFSDGIGRTGTFIAIYSQIERVKAEGVADVFQFIRRSRTQRAGLVRNEVHFSFGTVNVSYFILFNFQNQYLFCYEILADYADEMSKYDNFSYVS